MLNLALLFAVNLQAQPLSDSLRQSPHFPIALQQVTKKDPQLLLRGMEWEMLDAKQKQYVVSIVKDLARTQEKFEERVAFVKALVKRFDQTALDDKTSAEQLAQLPIFHEPRERDAYAYIQLPTQRRFYLKQIAEALAQVIARFDQPALNQDDLRALAARLLIEAELTLQSVSGTPDLVAKEAAKIWLAPLVLSFLLQGDFLSTAAGPHFAGVGLTVLSLGAFMWNIRVRDTGKGSPHLYWPKAYARAADKIRARLEDVFWTELQVGLMREELQKWNRGVLPADEFQKTIHNLIDGAKTDLTQIDCHAILSKAP